MKLIDVLVKQANGEIKEGSKLKICDSNAEFIMGTYFFKDEYNNAIGRKFYPSKSELNMECELIEPSILTDKEKEYLSNVIRLFKGRVENITKCGNKSREFVWISLKDEAGMPFPYFEKNTIYKGMELDKRYTLRELGLEEQ